MTHIDNALKSFNEAYDTSKYVPKWAGFIWLQGEFDGWNEKALADKYEENLTNLIKDIRQMAKADSMPVIIPMISQTTSSFMKWNYIDIIHKAEIAVTTKLLNCDTMNTNGYSISSADQVHFTAESQVKIGTISAQRWLAMKYLDVAVPVIKMRNNTSSFTPSTPKATTSFDLTGRKIVQIPAAFGSNVNRPAHMIINVDGTRVEKVLPVNLR